MDNDFDSLGAFVSGPGGNSNNQFSTQDMGYTTNDYSRRPQTSYQRPGTGVGYSNPGFNQQRVATAQPNKGQRDEIDDLFDMELDFDLDGGTANNKTGNKGGGLYASNTPKPPRYNQPAVNKAKDDFLNFDDDSDDLEGYVPSRRDNSKVPSRRSGAPSFTKDNHQDFLKSEFPMGDGDDAVSRNSRRSVSRRGEGRKVGLPPSRRVGTSNPPRRNGTDFLQNAAKTTGNMFKDQKQRGGTTSKDAFMDDIFGEDEDSGNKDDDIFNFDDKNKRKKNAYDSDDLFADNKKDLRVDEDYPQRNLNNLPVSRRSNQIGNASISGGGQYQQPSSKQNQNFTPTYGDRASRISNQEIENLKKNYENQIRQLKEDLSNERTNKERAILEIEKEKAIIDVKSRSLKNEIEQLKRTLNIVRENAGENLKSEKSNHDRQVKILKESQANILSDIRTENQLGLETMKRNYEMVIQTLKETNSRQENQLRIKTSKENKLDQRLDGFDVKMGALMKDNMRGSVNMAPDGESSSDLQHQIKKMQAFIESLKEQQVKSYQNEKVAQEKLEKRQVQLDKEETKLDEQLQAAKLRERKLEERIEDEKNLISKKEEKMRDLEKEFYLKEDRLRERESRLKRLKMDLDDRESEFDRKQKSRQSDLERLKDEVEERDFQSKRKLKVLQEKERDLGWKEENLKTNLLNVKQKEERMRNEQEDLNELTKKVKREQSEVHNFKNNFHDEERRLKDEKNRLNSLEVMINGQIEKSKTKEKNIEHTKRTLQSLRADYVRDLRMKVARDDFMGQSIPYGRMGPIQEGGDDGESIGYQLWRNQKGKEVRDRALDYGGGVKVQKFDYNNFMKDLDSKLNYQQLLIPSIFRGLKQEEQYLNFKRSQLL